MGFNENPVLPFRPASAGRREPDDRITALGFSVAEVNAGDLYLKPRHTWRHTHTPAGDRCVRGLGSD